MRIIKIIIVLSVVTALSGCSSIIAHNTNGIGHSYIGTEESFGNAGALTVTTAHYFFPALILTLPLSIIDVALSIVADTILLPIDLIAEPDDKERKTTWKHLKI